MNRRHFVAGLFGMGALANLTVVSVAMAQSAPRPIPEGSDTRERFLKLIDRPRVQLDAKDEILGREEGLVEHRFEYSSEKSQRVPGLLVTSESQPGEKPCVVVLHGTGGSKNGMRVLLRKLAKAGFVSVAIDARYAGDRTGGGKPGESYRVAIFEAWKSGNAFPFLYDTVWDVMRLIDYLQTRPEIDATRIGAIGFSKGGTELYLAAAVDPRIAVAIPCIGVQSFAWALEHNAWHSRISTIQSAVDSAARTANVTTIDTAFVRSFYDRVVPGIDSQFDGPSMLPLIAPRPLLVINGDRDDRTPRPGLELCVDAARQAYAKAGTGDRFEFLLQPDTGHAVTPQAEARAIDWLITFLGTSAKPAG